MSDPNTAFPEYTKPAPFDAPFFVWFLMMYGALSLVIDTGNAIWILVR